MAYNRPVTTRVLKVVTLPFCPLLGVLYAGQSVSKRKKRKLAAEDQKHAELVAAIQAAGGQVPVATQVEDEPAPKSNKLRTLFLVSFLALLCTPAIMQAMGS